MERNAEKQPALALSDEQLQSMRRRIAEIHEYARGKKPVPDDIAAIFAEIARCFNETKAEMKSKKRP